VLTKNRRENLLTHGKEARKLVEDAFDRAQVGLGLPKDRDPLAADRLTNPDKQKTRKAVDEVIARDRDAGGMSYIDARRRYQLPMHARVSPQPWSSRKPGRCPRRRASCHERGSRSVISVLPALSQQIQPRRTVLRHP
jgi:hypothetical protein